MPMYWTFNCFLGFNISFSPPPKWLLTSRKKGPSCPNWGQGGGLGDSGNFRKKTFFFIEAFPKVWNSCLQLQMQTCAQQPRRSLFSNRFVNEWVVRRLSCYTLGSSCVATHLFLTLPSIRKQQTESYQMGRSNCEKIHNLWSEGFDSLFS